MTNIEAKKNELEKLSAGNQRSYSEIQQATDGMLRMDFQSARSEMFIDFLQECGIISEEQRVDFELRFQNTVEQSLKDAWEKVRQAEKQVKLHVPASARQGASIVGMDGRPIKS